jgi:hypothetical protein
MGCRMDPAENISRHVLSMTFPAPLYSSPPPRDGPRHEPDRVPDPHVRQLPLGDELVDRGLREPQRSRHVRDGQQAVGSADRQQQTSSKISAICGEPWRNSRPARNIAASLSKTLRSRNRTCTISDVTWGASGRWFKSSRPDHLRARHQAAFQVTGSAFSGCAVRFAVRF